MSEATHRPGSETTSATETRPSVVVGIDGSWRNQAAVDFAAAEAAASGRPLRMVTAVDEGGSGIGDGASAQDHCAGMLEETRERILRSVGDMSVDTWVRHGNPVGALLESAGDQDLIVLGKRGLGAVSRLLIGSTSIRTAARSDAPVVVVPAGWRARERAGDPIVVAVDPAHPDPELLRFGFERARREAAVLRLVHAVDLDPVLVMGAAAVSVSDLHDWEVRSAAEVEAAVKPFEEQYPGVEVTVIKDRGHAADVILEAAAEAQLIVLGRRHRGPASWGLGSVAREVLHAADIPVAVVPVN